VPTVRLPFQGPTCTWRGPPIDWRSWPGWEGAARCCKKWKPANCHITHIPVPHVASHPRPNPLQASHTPRRTTQVAHGRECGAPALYNVRVAALPQDGQLPGTQDLERQTERSFAVHTHSHARPHGAEQHGAWRMHGGWGARQVGCRGVWVRRGAGRRGKRLPQRGYAPRAGFALRRRSC
jgi:hypothetical protein